MTTTITTTQADMLREFKNAGADEITTYGSTPGQNAGLLAAWRSAAGDSR